MWDSLLVLALLAALDPVRLGITLLVISRPRPVQNLLAYGVGSLTACVHTLVLPLTLLHVTPMFRSLAQDLANPTTSTNVRHGQIGMGLLALSIAVLVAVRSLMRRRAPVTTPAGNTPNPATGSNAPASISQLLGGARDARAESGSAVRRLIARAQNSWESGSLWVSLVIGFLMGGPPLDGLPFVLAVIAASGAAVGTQVIAVVVFVVAMLAVVEVTLVGHLIAPAKTQAVLRHLHDWALAHRRHVLVAIFTLIGISLLVRGTAIV